MEKIRKRTKSLSCIIETNTTLQIDNASVKIRKLIKILEEYFLFPFSVWLELSIL